MVVVIEKNQGAGYAPSGGSSAPSGGSAPPQPTGTDIAIHRGLLAGPKNIPYLFLSFVPPVNNYPDCYDPLIYLPMALPTSNTAYIISRA